MLCSKWALGAVGHGPVGGGDCNVPCFLALGRALNAITSGQKSVEALNEVGVAVKEMGNALNDPRGINAVFVWSLAALESKRYALLVFEILHDL